MRDKTLKAVLYGAVALNVLGAAYAVKSTYDTDRLLAKALRRVPVIATQKPANPPAPMAPSHPQSPGKQPSLEEKLNDKLLGGEKMDDVFAALADPIKSIYLIPRVREIIEDKELAPILRTELELEKNIPTYDDKNESYYAMLGWYRKISDNAMVRLAIEQAKARRMTDMRDAMPRMRQVQEAAEYGIKHDVFSRMHWELLNATLEDYLSTPRYNSRPKQGPVKV